LTFWSLSEAFVRRSCRWYSVLLDNSYRFTSVLQKNWVPAFYCERGRNVKGFCFISVV